MHPEWQINNGWIPGLDQRPVGVRMEQGKVSRILTAPDASCLTLDLHGLCLLPAFINSHDSLLASYLPFRGRNWPHTTWLSWDNELKASPLFQERMLLDVEDLYYLGAYRNLLSGSVFVVDHIPDFVRRPFEDELPVALLPDFGIAHSMSAYGLNWGRGIRTEYEWAVERDLPFVLHIAEGFDQDSRTSLRRLDEMGALGEHTVLVHGLSLSDDDLDRIAEVGAHVVWCPESNRFLYDSQPPVARMVERGINVCLGTDSAMAGGTDFLTSLRLAATLLEVDPTEILAMATVNAARAFRVPQRGALGAGQAADLVIFDHRRTDNLKGFLRELSLEDVFLVVRDGVPLYGDASLEHLFVAFQVETDRILIRKKERLARKGIGALLRRIEALTGHEAAFPFLPAK